MVPRCFLCRWRQPTSICVEPVPLLPPYASCSAQRPLLGPPCPYSGLSHARWPPLPPTVCSLLWPVPLLSLPCPYSGLSHARWPPLQCSLLCPEPPAGPTLPLQWSQPCSLAAPSAHQMFPALTSATFWVHPAPTVVSATLAGSPFSPPRAASSP